MLVQTYSQLLPFSFVWPRSSAVTHARSIRSSYSPSKLSNGVIRQFGLIIQDQRARVRNSHSLYLRIFGKRLPRTLEGDFIEAVCGIGKKLLVKAGDEREQRNIESGEVTGLIRCHEFGEITNLHLQRRGFHLLPHLFRSAGIVHEHLYPVVVAFPRLRRHIFEPLLCPRFIHIGNSLVRGRRRSETWVFRRWKKLYRHDRHVDYSAYR